MLTYGIVEVDGVWWVLEDGAEVGVSGPYLNKYMAQTMCDLLNEEE